MSDLGNPTVAPAAHGARGDPAPRCTFGTTTALAVNGPVTVLRVAGEVDLANVDLLHTELDTALAARPAVLVVDLAALTFCCVRGLTVLGRAGDTTGTAYAVAGLSSHLDRVWRTGWTDADRPAGFATVADAVRQTPTRAAPAATGPAPVATGHPVTDLRPECCATPAAGSAEVHAVGADRGPLIAV